LHLKFGEPLVSLRLLFEAWEIK